METLSLLARLSKDVRLTSRELSRDEARGLVDMYYKLQHQRIALAGQIRAINQGADEPETTNVLSFFQSQVETLENQIRAALGEYAQKFVAGRWAQSIVGIGPVISAGLLCHIDIERAKHASQVWRYAGIAAPSVDVWLGQDGAKKFVVELEEMAGDDADDPEFLLNLAAAKTKRRVETLRGWATKYGKNKLTRTGIINALARRPWNADFKTLVTYKLGESFVKQQNREGAYYGQLYARRKAAYMVANDEGRFAERAAQILRSKNYSKDTDAYAALSKGKLPQAQLHAMARRIAAKMLLAHFHHVLYETHYGHAPEKPWIVEHGGHVDYEAPPNWPMVE